MIVDENNQLNYYENATQCSRAHRRWYCSLVLYMDIISGHVIEEAVKNKFFATIWSWATIPAKCYGKSALQWHIAYASKTIN